MGAVERVEPSGRTASWRYAVAAVAVCAGLVVAPVHGVAWAEETSSTPTGTSSDTRTEDTDTSSGVADRGQSPNRPGPKDRTEPETEPEDTPAEEPADLETPDLENPGLEPPDDPEPEPTEEESAPSTDEPEPAVEEPVSTPPSRTESATGTKTDRDDTELSGTGVRSVRTARTAARTAGTVGLLEAPTPQLAPEAPVATPAVSATPAAAAAQVTTPAPPKPLSPIAQLIELPGRIVNAVLQFLDLTSAIGPSSPFHIAPINDLLFAAFREIERLVGLHRTPAVQPVLPTMTYTGPTDRPTPTVAQFLNASTAAYGWGTVPGGMVPLTDANGFQLQSTNIFSGMSGKAWVTPQGQVIIAYQGTTGGTNLLVNPIITLAQLAADMQVILTGTTPLAFYDALRFARRVQEEAALQGYAPEDVFVTGHSLGGWEAQFVAQRTGLAGIGFESPGLNTRVPGNGADSHFVNIAQYGSPAAFMATDLPGLQPFFPAYVPGGGAKPHYGPIVVIGDREAMNPMVNAAAMWGKSLIGSLVFVVDFLGNFFQYHLMGVQAYHLDVDPDPGVVPWLGTRHGTVHTGYGELTIGQLLLAASDDGILITP